MGQNISYSAMEVPGATSVYIQRPGGCCPEKAVWNPQKPPELNMIPDAAWQQFSQEVQTAVNNMGDEQMALWGAGFGWLPGSIMMHMGGIHWILAVLGFLLLIAGIVLPNVMRCQIVNKCIEQDQKIKQAIAQLQTQCQLSIEYKTMFTECCRPKGSQPMRMISFASPMMMMPMGAGMVGPAVAVAAPAQMLAVTVPPGSGPGTQLQIQTQQGPMNVIVPPGIESGGTFQVQMPTAPVAMAQPVQAQPAGVQGGVVQGQPVKQ